MAPTATSVDGDRQTSTSLKAPAKASPSAPAPLADHIGQGHTNGTDGSGRFDPTFTQHVVDTMGPAVSPRHRQVLGSLIRHLHDFAREVELTNDEWMTGVHFVNAVGQCSTKTRNEAHRVSDILGLES